MLEPMELVLPDAVNLINLKPQTITNIPRDNLVSHLDIKNDTPDDSKVSSQEEHYIAIGADKPIMLDKEEVMLNDEAKKGWRRIIPMP